MAVGAVTASLSMYPFAHLRDRYDELWSAVRAHLRDAPATLDHDLDLRESWHRRDLLLGQTCGWPLITELRDVVTVIGAFDVSVPFAADGRYRSVVVASKPWGVDAWRADPATSVAVNGLDSLSGWISLCHVWGGRPVSPLVTGAHVESMRAVAEGRAQLASIDALSFEFLSEIEPMTAGRLHVIGHGPLVPTLPLVMAAELAHRRDEVRAALVAAVADPATARARAALRIRGFVPLGLEDYLPLAALAPPPSH